MVGEDVIDNQKELRGGVTVCSVKDVHSVKIMR